MKSYCLKLCTLIALASFAACGGSSQSADNSISGNVPGFPSGVAASFALAGGPGAFTVLLNNRPELSCGDLQSASHPLYANSASLEIVVAPSVLDAGATIKEQVYPIQVGGAASAYLLQNNAACVEGSPVQATGGTVIVTRYDSAFVTGTYDITFGSTGELSGMFAAQPCAVPEAGAATADAGAPVCKP